MILVSVLVLGILVFVHELGHFLVAKFYGVGVLEFSIGFGKKIFSKRFGDTFYSIGLVPLGGYVRMVGDNPRDLEFNVEQSSTAEGEAEPIELHPIDKLADELLEDRSKWFLNKPVFPKAMVVLAGPVFNLLFAFLLSTFSFWAFGTYTTVDQPVIGDVIPGYPAEAAGIKPKDKVLAINGKKIETWIELASTVSASKGAPIQLSIERTPEEAGKPVEHLAISVAGKVGNDEMALVQGEQAREQYKIGILQNTERIPATFSEAVSGSAIHIWFISRLTVKSLLGMIQGAISPSNIAGPIFIFKEAAASAKRGIEHLFDFMIFLSVSLAVLNLLPIPVLDGGHLMFFLLEGLKGKPVSLRAQEMATQMGMFLLLLLMVFAVGNDIRRLF